MEVKLLVLDAYIDIDPARTPVPHRIGDRLAKQLLQVELEPDRD
jgi:hypothetical protein